MAGRSSLEPLASIHLSSDLEYDLPTGNRLYLYAFAAVAVFTVGALIVAQIPPLQASEAAGGGGGTVGCEDPAGLTTPG